MDPFCGQWTIPPGPKYLIWGHSSCVTVAPQWGVTSLDMSLGEVLKTHPNHNPPSEDMWTPQGHPCLFQWRGPELHTPTPWQEQGNAEEIWGRGGAPGPDKVCQVVSVLRLPSSGQTSLLGPQVPIPICIARGLKWTTHRAFQISTSWHFTEEYVWVTDNKRRLTPLDTGGKQN